MIISPLPSTANVAPKAEGAFDTLKSIKMRTQFPRTEAMPIAEPGKVGDNEGKLDPEVEDTQPISPQLAHLAKQRRALQVKEREFAAREEAFKATSQNGGVELARLKQEPLKVLLEHGVTYDQLADELTKLQGNPEIAALQAKIDALEKGVDDKFESSAAQQKQAVLAEMKREATQLVAQGDEFEFIRGMNKVPDVMQLIERTYDETSEVLDVSEACRLIEAELEKDVEKITSLGKVRQKFVPSQPQMQQRPQGMRTLTNRDTATPPLTNKQRAMAAFYNQLPR